jgi:hypothetical protein
MKNCLLCCTITLLLSFGISAQEFITEEYLEFRQANLGLTEEGLAGMYSRPAPYYYKGFTNGPDISRIHYLDSIILKLELTKGELELLKQNMFFVTERLSFHNFGYAFHTIYNYDLPVFITTDAILHALHMSYDNILKTLEREIMATNLEEFIQSLYDNFDLLTQKYGGTESLKDGLTDADIYVTMALSLITDQLHAGHVSDRETLQTLWEAIRSEKMVAMPLFTFPERSRNLDFSQFKVRGHYVYTEQDKWQGLKSLEPYFRAMMWLGRTDFLLTPPPENPWEIPWSDEEIQRMHYGAFMVNELMNHSGERAKFLFNEQVINYLVGESDNLTSAEYNTILQSEGITSATQLTDMETCLQVRETLSADPELGQKILSDFFLMDPNGSEPGVLPISYRVSGQRFIIDSYILGSVVFDKLMFNGKKVMRMMPKPLDALFALGNNDVLPLLQEEFDKYPYAEQLANLRYLTDNKTPEFWSGSLYNVWLNSIRKLNPAEEHPNQPLFMKTAAWHQEKMNTQLASWSHLRHDNLLYAKQSYTGGTGCSFPCSYVEPYPEFYGQLKQYAHDAGAFFSLLPGTNRHLQQISQFFPRFEAIMEKLETLARKELDNVPFSDEENEWLKKMLFSVGGSGMPPFSGWYTDLFFDVWDASEGDFTVVDVHTQPTDEFGHIVGKVLHTGVGKVNLGVFVARNPFNEQEKMAFVGPVMSYYEKITDDFLRLTDQDWEDAVHHNQLPERPEWTNIYLTNGRGEVREKGAELPSALFTYTPVVIRQELAVTAYPNPVRDELIVSFTANSSTSGNIAVFSSTGVLIKQTGQRHFMTGMNDVCLSFQELPEGIYLVRTILENNRTSVLKILKK